MFLVLIMFVDTVHKSVSGRCSSAAFFCFDLWLFVCLMVPWSGPCGGREQLELQWGRVFGVDLQVGASRSLRSSVRQRHVRTTRWMTKRSATQSKLEHV